MSLLYKPDWEQTMQNYIAWWNREDFGRCGLAVTAPKDNPSGPPKPDFPPQVEERWMDHTFLAQNNDYNLSHTFYGGEAIPVWNPGYNWQGCATFCGAKFKLDENTSWTEPMIADGELTDHDFRKIRVDYDSWVWKATVEMHKFAVSQAKGKSLPYIAAVGYPPDTLASFRTSYRLLTDLMDCPECVHDFALYLAEIWEDVFLRLYEVTKDAAFGGTVPWMHMWAPGKFYIPQNDFAYMISNEMYRNIFLDSLERGLESVDYALYHVDGVGNFRHVDTLCELDRINGLQILPGAGQPSPLHYMDILKRVQDAGKNLHISIPANELGEALENLSSKGLFIRTWARSEEAAKSLIRFAEKNSRFY